MSNEGVSAKAKNELLKLARNTLKKHFHQEEAPLDKNVPELKQTNGAFVTLHKKGALRGCIGIFEPTGTSWFHNFINGHVGRIRRSSISTT